MRRSLRMPALFVVPALAGAGCPEDDDGDDPQACFEKTAQGACEDAGICVWDNGDCIPDCTALDSQASCDDVGFCGANSCLAPGFR